jgi:hypothetical protein
MAVRVFCRNPSSLLQKIKDAIRAGSIQTWQLDTDGDLTHSPEQWKNLAWFRPVVEDDRIIFKILARTDKVMSKATYAVYHGRFIEMILTHFDEDSTRVTATSLPANGDIIGSDAL